MPDQMSKARAKHDEDVRAAARRHPAATAVLDVEDEHTTDAMRVARRQGWSLPNGTLAELSAALEAIGEHRPPEAFFRELGVKRSRPTPEQAAEAKRRSRNEQVNIWRRRKQLEAAIDARRADGRRRRQVRGAA